MDLTGKENERFVVTRRYFLIYLCAFILIIGIITVWFLSKGDSSEGSKYTQITADNGVVLNVLQTEPSSISLTSINDNVVQSGINGINGGFFWDDSLLSIAVMDGMPTNGNPNDYGSGWFNAKYARGTIVYDRVTKVINVQRAASVDELQMTDESKFWAQGGISMNLKDDSNWYNVAVQEEAIPFPDEDRLRSGMAYDSSGEIYLIVTSNKCTIEQFRTAIKENIAIGKLDEAIFLDGDGSSQLLAGKVQLKGDDRTVVQMIAVKEDTH
ncbi:phosphodiester glycosidase family protein [Paenibacillus endoradicis]|uniref:phosphodiester glycosidase family protein n=1 Tax=Paenibacillus endoradicis TaxID=2972487 RepID=UPI002158F34F|nr:phosphodiester glycosidase family protein [Paenibacillus endoradicis]MCR8656664.1 hypothetical protein [Paenibacillus endoradicis]